jgi:hypothetical protein
MMHPESYPAGFGRTPVGPLSPNCCRSDHALPLLIADVRSRWQHYEMNFKIARRPIGEAPDWVRDAWIGLSLSTVQEQRRTWWGVGVLSGPHSAFLQFWLLLVGRGQKVDGYVVNAKSAVDRLSEHHPEAAAWWREHTPRLLNGKRNFVFDADACEDEA